LSKNKRNFKSAGFYVALFLVIVLIVSYLYQGSTSEEKIYSDLISDIQAGNVKELVVDENVAKVRKNDNTVYETPIPSTSILHEDVGSVIKKQIEAGTLTYSTPLPAQMPWWLSLLPGFLLMVMILAWMLWLILLHWLL